MKKANPTRRQFIRDTALGAASLSLPLTAKSYRRILGANDRVRVGIVGFSNRCRGALIPAFQNNYRETNFEIVALSDIWNRRREEGAAFLKETFGNDITLHPNNESLYEANGIDAVIISTADFQHALHAVEAAHAGKDAYVEKPFAETMADARVALKAIREAGIIVQIGSQRRSGANYHRANDYTKFAGFDVIVGTEVIRSTAAP